MTSEPKPRMRAFNGDVAIAIAPMLLTRHVAAYPPGRVHRAVPPKQNQQTALRQRMAARNQASPSIMQEREPCQRLDDQREAIGEIIAGTAVELHLCGHSYAR